MAKKLPKMFLSDDELNKEFSRLLMMKEECHRLLECIHNERESRRVYKVGTVWGNEKTWWCLSIKGVEGPFESQQTAEIMSTNILNLTGHSKEN